MKQMAVTRFAVLIVLGAMHIYPAIAGEQKAGATPVDEKAVALEIQDTLHTLEVLIEKGVSAEELTRKMYTRDTIVAGGASAPRIGIEAEMRSIAGFLDSLAPPGQRKCNFSVIEPMTVSASVAAAFVNLTCRSQDATSDQPDQKYHILYVWKKTGAGWRVSLEMF